MLVKDFRLIDLEYFLRNFRSDPSEFDFFFFLNNSKPSEIFKKKAKNNNRSSYQRCSMKKGVLRSFTKFTEKHLCQSLFFNEVADLSSATLLKRRPWHMCFPVNFAKFLRTPLNDCFCNTNGTFVCHPSLPTT